MGTRGIQFLTNKFRKGLKIDPYLQGYLSTSLLCFKTGACICTMEKEGNRMVSILTPSSQGSKILKEENDITGQ